MEIFLPEVRRGYCHAAPLIFLERISMSFWGKCFGIVVGSWLVG